MSNARRDIFLWKRKGQSMAVLLISTATWVLLEVYQFSFLTVISWAAMFVVTSMFLWGNILRLLGKDVPDMSWLEISEESTIEMVNGIRAWIEEGSRWMFRVSAERDWFVFVRTVAGLLLLSYVGTFSDLLTLLYIGNLLRKSEIYMRYEDNIKRQMEWVKGQSRRFYDMIDEKVVKNMKNKIVKVKKEKKVE
ncbi:hypothetical protein ACB094_02G167600 [Castanea mollissima]